MKLLTALLLFSNLAKADDVFTQLKEWVFGRDYTRGLIELDVDVKESRRGYLSEYAQHLMELSDASLDDEYHHAGDDDNDERHDYIEKNLYDFYDIQLYAVVYIGSNKQKFEMIFDTGSSWVWVQSEDCQHCMKNDHKFVADDSDSYKQLSDEPSELNYGKGSVIGYDSKDMVCLMKDSSMGDGCMSDYLFKNIVA